MAFTDAETKWLTEVEPLFGARSKWIESKQEKDKRVDALDKNIEESKEELRALFDFEVTVERRGKSKVFKSKTKQVKAARGTEKEWDPDKEFDLGYYQGRIEGGQLDADIQQRLDRAYKMIDQWEQELKKPSGVSEIPQDQRAEIKDCIDNERSKAEKKYNVQSLEAMLKDDKLDAKQFKDVEEKLAKARQEVAQQVKLEKARIIKKYNDTFTEADIDNIVDPMMDELELRRELWDRLVRERIVPANFVPDPYNETKQQFSGADELYQQRAREEYDPQNESRVKAKKASKLMGNLKTIGVNVSRAIPGEEAQVAKQVTELVFDIGIAIAEGYIAVSKQDWEGGVKKLGDVAATACSRAVFFDADPNTLTAVANGITVGLSGAIAGKKIFEKRPPNWDQLVTEIGSVVENVFGSVAASLAKEEAAEDDDVLIIREVGRALNSSIVIGTKSAVAAANRDDPVVVFQAITQIAGQVIYNGLTTGADTTDKIKRDSPKVDPTAQNPEGFAGGSRDIDMTSLDATKLAVEQNRIKDYVASNVGADTDKVSDTLADLRKKQQGRERKPLKLPDEKLKQLKEKHQQEAQINEDELMEAELTDFRQQLMYLSGGEQNSAKALIAQFDANSIERMIAQIEMDRMKLKLAETLYDSVIGLTAQFVEPVMMAKATKDLIKDATMAIKRGLELHQWKKLNQEAINACSVQGYAFANRLKNLELQIADRTIKCVCELGQLAGGAIAASGVGAGAGVAISKGSTGAKAAWAIIKDIHTENDLRKQWNLYKRAINRPNDHRTMRAVLKGNPTLSKYAMAYAAMMESDPIAKKGLIACGLTNDMLANPESNAKLVVKFLEANLNEDPKLVKSLQKSKWQKEDNEPTMHKWSTNKGALKDLELGSVAKADSLLLAYEQACADFQRSCNTIELLRREIDARVGITLTIVPLARSVNKEVGHLEKKPQEYKELVANLKSDSSGAANVLEALDKLVQSKVADNAGNLVKQFKDEADAVAAYQSDIDTLLYHDACRAFAAKEGDPAAPLRTAAAKLTGALLGLTPLKTKQNEKHEEFAGYCQNVAARTRYAVAEMEQEASRLKELVGEYRADGELLGSLKVDETAQQASQILDALKKLKVEAEQYRPN